jgi:hypothetical protein
MVTPIGPGLNVDVWATHAPAQHDCTFADFITIGDLTVRDVYIAQGPANWSVAYQNFLTFQWDNWTGVYSQYPGYRECSWLKKRIIHWINLYNTAPPGSALANPGSYQYNLKRAKIQWGYRVYKKCCDPEMMETSFYALWPHA